jgi:hypothetical protein
MTFTLQTVKPTEKQAGVDFGAIVEDLDLETITRKYHSIPLSLILIFDL